MLAAFPENDECCVLLELRDGIDESAVALGGRDAGFADLLFRILKDGLPAQAGDAGMRLVESGELLQQFVARS